MGNTAGTAKSRPPASHPLLAFTQPSGLYTAADKWSTEADAARMRQMILTYRWAPRVKGADVDAPSSPVACCGDEGTVRGTAAATAPASAPGSPVSLDALFRECIVCTFAYALQACNRTLCCNRPMCTECFLHVQSPKGSAACPYCKKQSFGVALIKASSCSLVARNSSDKAAAASKENHAVAASKEKGSPAAPMAAAAAATADTLSTPPRARPSRGPTVFATQEDREDLYRYVIDQELTYLQQQASTGSGESPGSASASASASAPGAAAGTAGSSSSSNTPPLAPPPPVSRATSMLEAAREILGREAVAAALHDLAGLDEMLLRHATEQSLREAQALEAAEEAAAEEERAAYEAQDAESEVPVAAAEGTGEAIAAEVAVEAAVDSDSSPR
jgi:hypothetical protein